MGSSKEGQIKSAPAYTIVGREKSRKIPSEAFPGPGAYDGHYELLVKKQPHYSIGARVGRNSDNRGPGPGAHNPEKVFNNDKSL